MFRFPVTLTSIALWLFLQQAPAPATAPTPGKSAAPNPPAYKTVLDRLYRLVWPLGETKVDIPAAVTSGTEKSAPTGGVAHLYLVNTSTRTVREWPSAAGASQPVVCPDAKTLFYRRSGGLVKETFRLAKHDVSAAGQVKKFAGVIATRLYACTDDQKGGLALWAEDDGGSLRILRIRDDSAAWEDLPGDNVFAPLEPKELADDLQRMRSIRPDGFIVWIQNHQLVGRKEPQQEASLIVDSDLSFSGSPSWIGKSDFLFVTANASD
jgi:hypothetical protein